MAPPGSPYFTKAFIGSETTKPRALLFGIMARHHLADRYEVCSNYDPRSNNV